MVIFDGATCRLARYETTSRPTPTLRLTHWAEIVDEPTMPLANLLAAFRANPYSGFAVEGHKVDSYGKRHSRTGS